MKGVSKLTVVLLVLIILGGLGYWGYKTFLPKVVEVIPTEGPAISTTTPVIRQPKPNEKVTSPLTIKGVVPPGWAFEGGFPVSILDDQRNVITEKLAQEEVPGSWQTGNQVYFSVTLTFTTTAKSGFILLKNDNPSGDPSKDKKFEIPVNF